MPGSGLGFYSYGLTNRRWGNPKLIYRLMYLARDWKSNHDYYPRIGFGDISKKRGGRLRGHSTHRNGLDVDMRLIAKNNYEGPLSIDSTNYSKKRNKRWIVDYLKGSFKVDFINVQDPSLYNRYYYINNVSGHKNHIHLSIK
jgi:hypothetical protein